MMDYWTRMILATAIGGGIGFWIGTWWGQEFVFAAAGIAIGIATDASLRTIHNVGAPPSHPSIPAKEKEPSKKPPMPPKEPFF